MHHECSGEVLPLCVKSLAWTREYVKFDRRNLEALSEALCLSDEEKASLLVVSAFRMHFKQPSWFVHCRQPAVAAGHKLRIFRPTREEWPSGEGKRRPPGWVTCLRCLRVNPLGGIKWSFPCQLQDQGKKIQWRIWQNMQDGQRSLLCDVWQLTPDQVEAKLSDTSAKTPPVRVGRPVRSAKSKRVRARALAVAVGVVACMLNACEQPLLWSQCRFGGCEASHPGPSSVDSSSSSLSDLSFWCINTGGPKYAWTVLSDAARESVDVVALQELRMLSRELSAFSAQARQTGFALYAQPGPTGVGRWKEDRAWAGAALLVSTRLSSRACALVGGDGGQAVLAWVNGAVLGSCYVAQSDEAADFQAELPQNVAALSPSTRWMLMGDWNMTPSQNGVLASLQRCGARLAAVTDANMQALPTRWDGKRAIDYIVAHETCVISGLAFGDAHYNDHKLLLRRLRVAKMVEHVDWQPIGSCALLPTTFRPKASPLTVGVSCCTKGGVARRPFRKCMA